MTANGRGGGEDGRRTLLRTALQEVVDLLTDVEDAPDASGAVAVDADGEPSFLLVEGGRICWAAFPGQVRRLRGLLKRAALRSITEDELAEIARDCQAGAGSVLRALVDRGVLDEDGLRALVLRHVSTSLLDRLGRPMGSRDWIPHAHGGYRPLVSFSTSEVMATLGAALFPEEATTASGAQLDDGWPSSAFASDGDEAVACVAWSGDSSLGVRELARLGEWATAALGASAGFSPAVVRRSVDDATRAGWRIAVGWRTGRRVCRAAVSLADDLAPTVSRLVDRGVPVVTSAFRRRD